METPWTLMEADGQELCLEKKVSTCHKTGQQIGNAK